MKHLTRSLTLTAIALLFAVIKVDAQTSAELLTPNQEICEEATIDIKIQFTGTAPFDIRYRITNNETGGLITLTEQTGIYPDGEGTKTFPYTFYPGDPRTNQIKIELVEVRDNTIDWNTAVSGEAIITSYQMPTPFAGDDATNCGFSIPLNATPGPHGSNYQWSNISGPSTGAFTPDDAASTLFSASPEGIYDLRFTVTNGPCVASDDITVILNGSPTGNISTESKICESGEATLKVDLTGNGPWDVRYSNGTSNVDLTGITATSHTWTTTATGETSYTLVRIIDKNNCTAATTQMTGEATVIDLKQTVDPGPDTDPVCGNQYTMQALPGTGTGTWSGPAGASFTNVNSSTSGVSVTNYGTQAFTWSLNNEGCVSEGQVNLTFVEPPTVTITDAPSVVCEGSTALISLALTGLGDWDVDYLSGSTPATTSFQTSTATLSLAPEQTTTYSITRVTDSKGCFTNYTTRDFTISVDEMPEPNAGEDIEVCGTDTELRAVASIGTGLWTGPGTIDSPTAPGSAYSNGYGAYTLRWTETNGVCTAWDEVNVTLWEAPTSTYAGPDQELYMKFESTMEAEAPLVGQGTWSILDGQGSIVDLSNPGTGVTGLVMGNATFRWTVTNGTCPSVYDDVMIEVLGLKHTTGFSPNGDGINDAFEIQGAPYIENNELIVFNQAGEVVFKQKDYQNDWTGLGTDGQPVPEGYYYFVFTGTGINPIKDFLVIKRSTR